MAAALHNGRHINAPKSIRSNPHGRIGTVSWRMHLTDIAIAQGVMFILLNLIGWSVNMMLIHFPRQMLKMTQPLFWISIAIQLFLFIVNHVLRRFSH